MSARPEKVERLLRAWGFGDKVVTQFEEEEIDEEAFDCLDRPLIQQLFKTVGAQAKFLKHYNIYLKDKKAPNSDVTEVKPETIEQLTHIKTEKNDEGTSSLVSISGIESLASCSSWTPADIHQHVHVPSKRPHPAESQEEFLMADFQDNTGKRLRLPDTMEDIQLDRIPHLSPPLPPNQIISVSSPLPIQQTPMSHISSEEARPSDIIALRELLEKNASGSLLFSKRGDLLSVRDRRRLADLVVNNEMGGRTNTSSIPPKRLEELSRAICVLFPKESQAAYFTPYFAMNEQRVLQGGALTTAHLALRREINRNKNGHRLPSVDPVFPEEELSPAVIEDLNFLKNNVEPWEEVETKWRHTFDARRRLIDVDQTRRPSKLSNSDLKSAIRAEKAEKIATYFEDFKPLQQPSGFILLEQDFASLYPDKEMTFYINWKPFCDKAITALRNTSSLPPEWKQNVDILAGQMDAGADIDYVRLLMSLSGLVPTATAVNRTATRPLWRPSKAEIQAGFVTHIKDYSSIGAEVRKRHDKFNVFDQTVQPFVILVGKTLDWIEASYTVIDKQLYSLETPVRAVEVALKAHLALGVSYSVESKALWLMIQICLFEIRTDLDKLYQCASVIKVLSDFGMEL